MAFLLLVVKSAFRNRLRALLTSVGVAIAIIAFLFLRTFIAAWYAGVDAAGADRMIVRNKTSIIFSLPLSYATKLQNVPGVSAVSYENWFGGYYKDPKQFFAKFAMEDHALDLYPEAIIPPDQMQAYKEDKQGAIVGRLLAQKYGWKVGDRVTITGDIYPGDWDFNIRAIYTSTSKTFDQQTMFFHWSYLNDAVNERRKDKIGIILFKVADANASSSVGRAVDALFANSDNETHTESEKAFQLEFLSMSSALISAIQLVSGVVLVILMLILANTLAMATRERTTEYAVMRAIGFRPGHVVWLVVGEGFVIAAVGVAIGVGLATPVLRFFADVFQTYLGPFLGEFGLDPKLVVEAVVVALAGGMIASALPARRAGRLNIVDALRRVE
jgi:putative ABC transport system permease protein